MPPGAGRAAHGEEGTASVELVAVVPFLLLALLVAAQIALAGQALWSASVAARAGARAALVGGDASAAARSALPPAMRKGAHVEEGIGAQNGGEVSVRVEVPRLVPSLPEVRVGARSGMEAGDG
ncbi:MAG: pilus assembly protein [Actinobacteria bacterium]|nr:MAG: pilus assembly protein [Actinomycetota bacterium]